MMVLDPNDIPPPPDGFTLDPHPAFTGVIPGAPKPQADQVSSGYVVDPNTATARPVAGMPRPHVLSPAEVKAQGLDTGSSWQQKADGSVEKIGALPQADSEQQKKDTALEAARNTVQSIEKARGLVSNWSAGLGGAVGRLYPGSDQAKQLETVVNQELRGNIFQNWVAQLKSESTTGTSGIGRIMQSEIPLVTGALGALDPVAMGREGTLQSFDQIENRILRTAAKLNGENPDDPNVLAKYQKQFGASPVAMGNKNTPPADGSGPGDGGGNGGSGGGSGPPGVSNLSPDQKNAYDAFLAANPQPSGEQVGTFLTKLTGQQVTNADEIAKAIAQGRGTSSTVENLTEEQKVKARRAAEDKAGLADSPATTLAVHGATLGLSDEAAGVGNALSDPLHPVEGYTLGRDVERQRIADAQQQLGYAAAPIEFVGGLASGAPTSALAAVANDIPALAAQGAKAGSVGGALAGFGQGQGTQQSLTGAGVGAAGGAAVGVLAPYAAGRLSRAPQGMAPDVAAASQAEGVDLVRPMVDPASRGKFGALESAPGSQNVIRDAVAKVRGQIESRVGALGQGRTALETDAAGERIQNAARNFIQRSKGVANTLYNRARSLSGDARVVPQNAISAVDNQIATLSANPQTNAGEISFLNGIKNDLSSPGGKTVEELRQLRQSLRGRINEQNLTATQAEARASGVLDAAQQDVAANLPKGAADAYRRADAFYRERMVHIDDILDRFLGGNVQAGQARTSGEQAFQRLKNMMAPGGDARRLAGLMRDLEPGERQDIAATIASSLGRRAPDQPFSPDLFLSQTSKLSPQAQRTVFGPDAAQSVANLRLLSQRLKEGVGDVNRSKTANSMLRQMASRFVGSLTGFGGMAGLAEGGLATGGKGALAGLAVGGAVKGAQVANNILSARAMVNPRVTQWLAQAADVSTPSQAQQAVKGLSLVISREPALAQELTPIRDFLDQRVTQLLAAKPASEDKNQQ
jgi:hypothetical protein